VACSNCHTIMKSVSQKFQLKTVYEPETCFQCHKDKRAQNGAFVTHAGARRQDGLL
jgi:Doubled CXXCH motif (Paired_CXXCH_1).